MLNREEFSDFIQIMTVYFNNISNLDKLGITINEPIGDYFMELIMEKTFDCSHMTDVGHEWVFSSIYEYMFDNTLPEGFESIEEFYEYVIKGKEERWESLYAKC